MHPWRGLMVMLLMFLCLSTAQAETYQSATILSIQPEHPQSVVHKATDASPPPNQITYDVTVRLQDMVYVGRYVSASDYIPSNWEAGKPVEMRVGHHKHRIYLKDVAGKDVALRIIAHHPASPTGN